MGGGQSSQGRGSVNGGENRMSTHYMAGGMPLAFTQEDFLIIFMWRNDSDKFCKLPSTSSCPTLFCTFGHFFLWKYC